MCQSSRIYLFRFFHSINIWSYSYRFCLLVNCSIASPASSIYTRRRVPTLPLHSWSIPHSIQILPRVSFLGCDPFPSIFPIFSRFLLFHSPLLFVRVVFHLRLLRSRIRVPRERLDHGATMWREFHCSNVIAQDAFLFFFFFFFRILELIKKYISSVVFRHYVPMLRQLSLFGVRFLKSRNWEIA